MIKRILVVTCVLVAALTLAGMVSVSTPAVGPRTTGVVVQNLGDASGTVRLDYYNQTGAIVAYTETTVAPASALGFSAKNQTGLTDGFVGSLVVSADQPIAAIGNDTDDDSTILFSAVTQGAKKLYVPAAYRGSGGWQTEIWIQAVQTVPSGATATIKFYDRNGVQTGATKTINLISFATLKVMPSDYVDIPDGWSGGAVIESTYDLGAIVKKVRSSAAGTITEGYNAFSQGDTTVYVPVIYRKFGAWDSNGINVQNIDTAATTVGIDFYDRTGAYKGTYTFTNPFPANGGVQAINTNNIAFLSDGYAGTAVVRSTGAKIIAVVNTTSGASGYGAAYNAVLASEGSTKAYLPSQYKRYGGWRSGIIAMNIGASATTIAFDYYARGATVPTAIVTSTTTVGKYISFAANTTGIAAIPDGWSGTAVVRSTGQPIVVVSNVEGLAGTSSVGKADAYNAFPKLP